MALRPSAVLTFRGYEVVDTNIVLTFVCSDPGAGQPSEYAISVTDVELAAATTNALLRTLVTDRLNRKFRALNIATKLDPFVGQTITI